MSKVKFSESFKFWFVNSRDNSHWCFQMWTFSSYKGMWFWRWKLSYRKFAAAVLESLDIWWTHKIYFEDYWEVGSDCWETGCQWTGETDDLSVNFCCCRGIKITFPFLFSLCLYTSSQCCWSNIHTSQNVWLHISGYCIAVLGDGNIRIGRSSQNLWCLLWDLVVFIFLLALSLWASNPYYFFELLMCQLLVIFLCQTTKV